MPGTNSERPDSPVVRDRRVAPPGVVPKNIQAWALTAIAAVMVLVIAVSGRKAPPRPVSPVESSTAVVDPSAMRIRDYQRRIEEQVRKLELEQADALQAEQGLGRLGRSGIDRPSRGSAAEPSSAGPNWSDPDRDWIRSDWAKREHDARFASNVALSFRKDRPALPPRLASAATATPAAEQSADTAVAQSPSLVEATGKRFRLFEGTFLETVLTNRLDGSFAGPINCMLTTHVYSHDHRHLLIPQGTRVLGEVRRVDSFGQQRLAVVFHRLIMPDGFSLSLDQFQGLNQIGETGLRDKVNHHYLQVFGVSLAIGAIAGLGQMNSRSGLEVSDAELYQQNVSASLAQSSLHILDRYLNVLPTFTIREGHRVKIYLSGDLLLPAYDAHRLRPDL